MDNHFKNKWPTFVSKVLFFATLPGCCCVVLLYDSCDKPEVSTHRWLQSYLERQVMFLTWKQPKNAMTWATTTCRLFHTTAGECDKNHDARNSDAFSTHNVSYLTLAKLTQPEASEDSWSAFTHGTCSERQILSPRAPWVRLDTDSQLGFHHTHTDTQCGCSRD